jgi:hypothetical protein
MDSGITDPGKTLADRLINLAAVVSDLSRYHGWNLAA